MFYRVQYLLIIESLILGQDVLHVVPLQTFSKLSVRNGVASLYFGHLFNFLVEPLKHRKAKSVSQPTVQHYRGLILELNPFITLKNKSS